MLRGLLAIVLIAALAGCAPFDPSSAKVRYRLDIVLKVDGETVKASGVYELTMRPGGGDGSGNVLKVVSRFRGQAIVVPIKGGPQALIILMAYPYADDFSRLFLTSCGIRIGDDESPADYFARITADYNGTCRVATGALRLLTIADPRDMSTLEVASKTDPGAALGIEVQISSASVAKTDKPVSTDLHKALPWLPQYGQTASPDYIATLRKLDLIGAGEVFSSGDFR